MRQTNYQDLQTRQASRTAMHHDVRRDAFTLVEMLVSVALVLLMMTMFAQVFQMAGGSISQMRGMAENDQRARTLQTILKADLDKRTFRWVYPFAANEDPNAMESNIANRQGYFYISENNPFSTIDDILQFTVSSTVTKVNQDTTPYYGQATTIPDPNSLATVQSPFINLPNQPDADDGILGPNSTGQSNSAEVTYFLRNGNLYRRQLLVREPLTPLHSRIQPDDNGLPLGSGNPPQNIFNPAYAGVPGYTSEFANGVGFGTFWGDFDYSATFGGTTVGAQFLGDAALNNSGTSSISVMGNPAFRFGFAPPASGGTLLGRPKEFGPSDFLGRYTLQECSAPIFHYPQGLAPHGIPTDPTYAATLARDSTGAVVAPGVVTSPDDFSTGLRRGEDLLLSNVHSFDIQVWDQAFGGFVNIGDPNLNSDYSLSNRYQGQGAAVTPGFGPQVAEVFNNGGSWVGAINAVFDTWHPDISVAYSGNANVGTTLPSGTVVTEAPPYRPVLLNAQSITGRATDIPGWAPGTTYPVFNPATNAGIVFPAGTPGYKNVLGSWSKLSFGSPFVYRCIVAGTSSLTTEPNWPKADGQTVSDGLPGSAVLWECVDNRKPLKAIKITIRYVDVSTQQMRQLTVIQSLVD